MLMLVYTPMDNAWPWGLAPEEEEEEEEEEYTSFCQPTRLITCAIAGV